MHDTTSAILNDVRVRARVHHCPWLASQPLFVCVAFVVCVCGVSIYIYVHYSWRLFNVKIHMSHQKNSPVSPYVVRNNIFYMAIYLLVAVVAAIAPFLL